MTRLLILGTGNMANAHANAFAAIPGVDLVAGVDVSQERLDAFALKHGMKETFTTLEAAIAWGAFDAAANVTPDPVHYPTTMQLLAAKKHVFCEKPLAEDYPKAKEMADAADAAGVINMVNLTYRNVAQLQKMRTLIAEGAIGSIRHVEASYRQSWLVGNMWGDWKASDTWLWRLSEAHGSKGVLGDVGIHILDFTTFATGLSIASIQARLKTFDKAPDAIPKNTIGKYTLDANDSAMMSVAFDNGALGVIHASRFMTGYTNTLRLQVFGDQGAIEIEHGQAYTTLRMVNGENVHKPAWQDIVCDGTPTNYQKFIGAIVAGKNNSPDFRHAANLQKILDTCQTAEAQRGVVL
jgi:predicted dehydrogenase